MTCILRKFMDHDLSKCKINDWIYTLSDGWVQVKQNKYTRTYPICCTNEKSYTHDGKEHTQFEQPSAYIEPPSDWIVPPKPQNKNKKLKKDTLVKVFDILHHSKIRHFKRFDGDNIVVYGDGADSYTDEGKEEIWNSWEIIEEKK